MVRAFFALISFNLVAGQDLFLSARTDLEIDAAGSVHKCLQACQKSDDEKHFKNCSHDGSTSCMETKCCQYHGDTCFVKNAYWASCHPYCKTGIPDSTGEEWDCTPISPSGCHHLQQCVEKCAPGLSSNSTLTEDAEEDLDVDVELTSEEEIDVQLGKEVQVQGNSLCPNKHGLGACVRQCKSTGVGPDHGSHCAEDGRTSCLNSKCCKHFGDKCFTKNPYWAACIGECKPGKVNKVDNQVWDCKELKPKKVCDAYKYRTCIDTCVEKC